MPGLPRLFPVAIAAICASLVGPVSPHPAGAAPPAAAHPLAERGGDLYVDAGLEVDLAPSTEAVAMGEVGHAELTAGYWIGSWVGAEMQLAVGRVVDQGYFEDTVIANTLASVGAGARLALPLRLSPVAAAHVGIRHVIDSRGWATCGDACARAPRLIVSEQATAHLFADIEAGFQLNLGVFSMSATVEYARMLADDEPVEVLSRTAPGTSAPQGATDEKGLLALNLQCGVRF